MMSHALKKGGFQISIEIEISKHTLSKTLESKTSIPMMKTIAGALLLLVLHPFTAASQTLGECKALCNEARKSVLTGHDDCKKVPIHIHFYGKEV